MAQAVWRTAGLAGAAVYAVLAARSVAAPPEMSPLEELGRAIFFDTSLSNPAGQSCASCHDQQAGFTFPTSRINKQFGVAPGAVRGRFGSRAVPQISYSAFNPEGPRFSSFLELYIGGQFWDGHAPNLVEQAKEPLVEPNEGNNLTHNAPDPALVVQKLAAGQSAAAFREVFGEDVFTRPTDEVYDDLAQAIAAYERTSEVSPFSSKYDAWRAGRAELTPSELNGLRLTTGTWTGRPDGAPFARFAHCVECHMIPSVPSATPDLWTSACYENIGVPRNADNPFYTQTNGAINPAGYNPLGSEFVDYGLGKTLYQRQGLPAGNVGPGTDGRGDFLGVNGLFKAPSLRNVDRRPRRGFVKAYMHNGSLKSLREVVHFYNTRNLTTEAGEVIDFTQNDPYAGLRGTPLWGTPEYPSIDTLVNAEGALGTLPGTGHGGESGAQVGNLGLTKREEADIVAFLRTLSDGYFDPFDDPACIRITSQPVSQRACRNDSARFTVASAGSEVIGYQWRKNGIPLADQTFSFFDIVRAKDSDRGLYDCVIVSACGEITSRAAALEVCEADFNCSGEVGVQDIFDFLAAFFAADWSADVNDSGELTVQDIFDFLRVYFAGCP